MKKINDFFRTKGFYVSLMAGAICIVALGAVFMRTMGDGYERENGEIQNESGKVDIAEKYNAEVYIRPTAEPDMPTAIPEAVDTQQKPAKKKSEKPSVTSAPVSKDVGVTVMEAGKNVANLSFDQDKGIIWPVEGEVLMQYSADKSVYFKTLGQYKINPALIISANEGSAVKSSTKCVVTKVSENEEIGKYIETSIGDDYKIIYGQLADIQVKKGDMISEGEIIGRIAQPTKYYIEEGSNLYMQMICGKETVDPLIFLD